MSQEIIHNAALCFYVTAELKWLINKVVFNSTWICAAVNCTLEHRTKSETTRWKPLSQKHTARCVHRGHPYPQHTRLTSPSSMLIDMWSDATMWDLVSRVWLTQTQKGWHIQKAPDIDPTLRTVILQASLHTLTSILGTLNPWLNTSLKTFSQWAGRH